MSRQARVGRLARPGRPAFQLTPAPRCRWWPGRARRPGQRAQPLDRGAALRLRGASAGTSRRPSRPIRCSTRVGGRRRSRSGSAAAPAAGSARPPVHLVRTGPSNVTDVLGPQPAQQLDLLLDPRVPRLWNSSPSASYSTGFQPTPTPRRNRPPLSTSTSAACLATSAVCRCGRMMTPVTSSMRWSARPGSRRARTARGTGLALCRPAPAGAVRRGRRRARGRRPADGCSPCPRRPARSRGWRRVGADLGLWEGLPSDVHDKFILDPTIVLPL